MFGNLIGLLEFWGSGFRCEDRILLCFCLQIGNDKMLKPNNEICLKSKYQLKQKTISREKILQLIKIAFFEKWIFSNSFIIYFQSSTKVFSTTGTSHRMTFSYVNSITGVTFVGKCPWLVYMICLTHCFPSFSVTAALFDAISWFFKDFDSFLLFPFVKLGH